ncbi:MAG: hypothetical protein IGR92_13860 [Leptolyngbyaceae cyanobacterium T60_A2020_046]|nr:hypothetical protein [Leptolyngbyaceae cyanobacterium T60_A2020_046]
MLGLALIGFAAVLIALSLQLREEVLVLAAGLAGVVTLAWGFALSPTPAQLLLMLLGLGVAIATTRRGIQPD